MDKQKLNCLFFSGLAELTDFFRNATDKSFDILSTSFHRFDVLALTAQEEYDKLMAEMKGRL